MRLAMTAVAAAAVTATAMEAATAVEATTAVEAATAAAMATTAREGRRGGRQQRYPEHSRQNPFHDLILPLSDEGHLRSVAG